MLDPPALVFRIGLGQFLYRVDHLGIGSIADGVNSGLETIHRRAHHQVTDFGARQKLQTGLAGGIGIGLFEPCAPAAQRAIEIKLYAT